MKSCDDCQFHTRKYADGYVKKDWSSAGVKPSEPASKDSDLWTYLECSKNNKGLKHLNLTGNCTAYKQK